MKKFILLAFATILAVNTSSAQYIRGDKTASNSSIEHGKNSQWYVRAGLGLSKQVGPDAIDDDEVESMKSVAGYDFMVGFQKKFGSSDLYWGMEYGLGSRGYKYVSEDMDATYSYKFIAHNVKIVPFQLGYKYNIGETDFAVDPHLSAFVSFDYTGKLNSKTEWNEGWHDGKTEEEDYSLGNIDDYQRFDAGIQFGVGVWYKKFNLDFTYQRGFISQDTEYKMFCSQFMIRLGYAF